jgi:hypothetical protein
MVLFQHSTVRTVLFILLLFSISIQSYSQELTADPQEFTFDLQELTPDSIDYQIPDTIAVLRPFDPLFYRALGIDYFPHGFEPIIFRDTVILFSPNFPVVFDIRHLNSSRSLIPECSLKNYRFPPVRLAKHGLFADANNRNDIHRQAMDYLLNNRLDLIEYTAAHFSGEVEALEKLPSNVFQSIFTIDYEFEQNQAERPERFRPQRRYWVYSGNHQIQLSQNYMSENWYKGGSKHFNLVNVHKVTFTYSKNRFTNNNIFDWNMSLFTNENDSIRPHRIGQDLIRTYSDFNILAFGKWSYSTNIEIRTQIFNNFRENTNDLISAAFSPLYVNVGILGMKYDLRKTFPRTRGREIVFNADISPLSVNYIAVLNSKIDPTRFGIEAGKKHTRTLGSKVTANLTYKFNQAITFTSRFNYFTNFESVVAESENRLNMPINRFFSTTLYLFLRYDDNPKLARHDKLGLFQMNEQITFGFNYTW